MDSITTVQLVLKKKNKNKKQQNKKVLFTIKSYPSTIVKIHVMVSCNLFCSLVICKQCPHLASVGAIYILFSTKHVTSRGGKKLRQNICWQLSSFITYVLMLIRMSTFLNFSVTTIRYTACR